MQSFVFREWESYPIVFAVQKLDKSMIQKEYLTPYGIPEDDVKCVQVPHGKQIHAKDLQAYVEAELLPTLQADPGITYVICCDAKLFQLLSNGTTADQYLGYVRDFEYNGTKWPWKLIYVPSFKQVFYDPERTRAKIKQGLQALLAHVTGTYQPPGDSIIHSSDFPETDEEVEAALERVLAMDCNLTMDLETFSLRNPTAKIGTVSLCWSKHEGIAFAVDYKPIEGATSAPYGICQVNHRRRRALKNFLIRFKRKLTFHNIAFDGTILIFELFMESILDREGLLHGLGVVFRDWDCTQLITYLATNSCAGNTLNLKDNAQEFSGKYAVDVTDITTVPLKDLLKYNLIDGLSAWYVLEKHWPTLVRDNQEQIYKELFKPSTVDIVDMQLTGLPIDMKRVKEVKIFLEAILDDALNRIYSTKTIQKFNEHLRMAHVEERNRTLKKKRISLTDPETLEVKFNPNSGPQLQVLLYDMLAFPVLDLTENKNPATGGDVLIKLLNYTTDPDVQDLLRGLLDYIAVAKLLGTFIPAFEAAIPGPDGWHYLVGSFKLGGTLSGRMSSHDPNMQNLPANTEMSISEYILKIFTDLRRYVKKGKLALGKLIKSCFSAPPGWILIGLDFNALEDRISALTTKDPNKLKVYIDGYDGHSLRTFAYWRDKMPDIVDTIQSINSIQKLYPELRTRSKPPTFALTYQGTWRTLVTNCGFTEAEAKAIEANYRILYVVSIEWVRKKLDQASVDGFVTGAFGLRIRTPLLVQVVRGTSRTPYEAEAEGRSAGNALGQSWCLLTNRAAADFMSQVRAGPQRLNIKPCTHIHDAQYYMVSDDMATLLYTNERLVKAVQWQDHPDITHPDVHLGGTLSVFWPDWATDIEIPNGADEAAVMAALEARLERA